MSWTETYRPKTIQEMLLKQHTKKALESVLANIDNVRTLLLVGPSGMGKTTAARILANDLLKQNTEKQLLEEAIKTNILEINGADNTGVDDARRISKWASNSSTLFCNRLVIILDEAQMLTKQAQNCILKPQEDNPGTLFIICSSEPEKLINAIKTRGATKIDFPIFNQENDNDISILVDYLDKLSKKAGYLVVNDILIAIAKSQPNSIRSFILKLELICKGNITKLNDEVYEILNGFAELVEVEAVDLARLIAKNQYKLDGPAKFNLWPEIAKKIDMLSDNPDGTRIVMSKYLTKVLLDTIPNGNNLQAFLATSRLNEELLRPHEMTKERLVSSILKAMFWKELGGQVGNN